MVNKSHKYIYLYIKFAFISHMILLPLLIIGLVTGLIPQSIIYKFVFFGLMIINAPAFFMLPGIIYDDYKPTYLGLTPENIKYDLFLGLTLGFGPIYIFFKHHNQNFKRYIENNT